MSDFIICDVCPHACRLKPGAVGECGARGYVPRAEADEQTGDFNGRFDDKRSVPLNYGIATSLALDPIEKKPLRHFSPGSRILSYGSLGCNLKCPFCQNHEISMQSVKKFSAEDLREAYISPEKLTETALKYQSKGNIGVAFTYNEPLICYEYVLDTAKLLKKNGLKTVLVTNGCVNEKVADMILKHVDALNIDLKSFRADIYDKTLKGSLEAVKGFISKAVKCCHVELTTLIVPEMNSDVHEMKEISEWIASLDNGAEIPLHISRFFPRYRMKDAEPTDIGLIYKLAEIARNRLKYVYTGNC